MAVQGARFDKFIRVLRKQSASGINKIHIHVLRHLEYEKCGNWKEANGNCNSTGNSETKQSWGKGDGIYNTNVVNMFVTFCCPVSGGLTRQRPKAATATTWLTATCNIQRALRWAHVLVEWNKTIQRRDTKKIEYCPCNNWQKIIFL